MGDRAQIAVKMDKDSKVYLYTHSAGYQHLDILKAVLSRRARWDDQEYLARMIFSAMIANDITSETGYGLGTYPHGDLSYPIPVLDCDKELITWEKGSAWSTKPLPKPVSFTDFIKA